MLIHGQSVISIARSLGVTRSAIIELCIGNVERLELYPGVRKTLRKLTDRGCKLGVATSLSGKIAEPALMGLDLTDFFHAVVHAGNCRAAKPSPRPLQLAQKLMEIEDVEKAFFVGDSEKDAYASLAANLPFAWASYGYTEEAPRNTHIILQDFTEVISL